jgi:uncharacterized membrane protein YfcA
LPTSLAIITFSAAWPRRSACYADFDWSLTAAFLGSALTGMVGGSMITRRVAGDSLRRAFGWAVIALGTAILGLQVLRRAGLW